MPAPPPPPPPPLQRVNPNANANANANAKENMTKNVLNPYQYWPGSYDLNSNYHGTNNPL
jgi:hypothetical protein